jgi:hypothetical protein
MSELRAAAPGDCRGENHLPRTPQRQAGFLALRDACHGVKHLNFASDPTRRDQLLRHFAAVNRLTPDQAEAHLAVARQQQGVLDHRTWKVDYGAYNASVPCLRDTHQRRAFLRSSGRCGFAAPLSRTPVAGAPDSFWRDDSDY